MVQQIRPHQLNAYTTPRSPGTRKDPTKNTSSEPIDPHQNIAIVVSNFFHLDLLDLSPKNHIRIHYQWQPDGTRITTPIWP